jgi:hypothetical protein
MLDNFVSRGIAMDHIILIIVLAAVPLVALFYLQMKKHDSKEPPLISPRVPIIGHAIGIIRHGVPYYTKHR